MRRHRPADVDLPGATVVPGFVDTHVHGGGGASFDGGSTRRRRPGSWPAHRAHGTTTMLASLVTDTRGRADRLGATARRRSSTTALLAGIHLEGPWLSPAARRRARPGAALDPDRRQVEAGWSRRAAATCGWSTIAPELPGGVDAVRRLTAAGVVAAIGHTDATYDQARAALDAGAAVGTHLFNAMRALHHREPGPVAALLEHPDAYVELIADGVHVHPAMVRTGRGGQAAAHRAGHRRDGRGGRGRTATTGSARSTWPVRDGVARLACAARSPAPPRPWPRRCGTPYDVPG